MAGCSYFLFIFLKDVSQIENSENLHHHVHQKNEIKNCSIKTFDKTRDH